MIKINLDKFIIDFEMALNFESAYLNRETGELEMFTEEEVRHADYSEDEIEQFDDAEKETIKKILNIWDNDDERIYVKLPTNYDVHEWSIMKDFCYSIPDSQLQNELLNSIHGRGAFRIFKNTIHKNNLVETWDKFHNNTLKNILQDWCEENGIEYE